MREAVVEEVSGYDEEGCGEDGAVGRVVAPQHGGLHRLPRLGQGGVQCTLCMVHCRCALGCAKPPKKNGKMKN